MAFGAVKNSKEKGDRYAFSTIGADFDFKVVYPEENPRGALLDVTKTLDRMGAFDGLKEDK